MSWVKNEQEALVGTLRSTDPDGQTLCEGWNVRRLLAHLTERDQEPVALVKDMIARKPPGQEPGLSKLTSRARSPEGYEALIQRFSHGAPRWSPMSWAGERLNLVEYVIHHEDIRRGGTEPAKPRDLPEGEQQAVWQQLGMPARLGLRKSPVGVRLATPGGQSRVVKAGDGVTLTGEPVELALWVSGRRRPAQVEVTGSAEAIDAFQAWADAD
ncbi:MAG: TIGR03085 family protein [Microlunatus sp.]|nr:TIGR03085 family protein [Microlunatus sp.]